MHADKRRYTIINRRASACIGGVCALLLLLLAVAPLPTGMFLWDPPAPIVEPLTVTTTGGAATTIYVGDDGDVASINVRAARRCYSVTVSDASGQSATFGERSACGLTIWLPAVWQP